jgi:hypothetical protein
MYAYLHPACGRPAWLMIDKPTPGISFLSAKTLRLDYNAKDMTQGCTCESCGQDMFGAAGDINNVVNYIKWLIENPVIRAADRNSKIKLL